MSKWFSAILLSIVLFSLCGAGYASGSEGSQELMPKLTLTIPENMEDLTYLGITGKAGDAFDVGNIDADILLIELFSMYCPFCQEEAPFVNELHEKMRNLPANGPEVRIIGLGAGNTLFEVNHFKSTYDVGFPLFPDQDLSMYKALKGEGTPGFVGLKKDQEKGFIIILRQSGGFHSVDDFLEQLLTNATKD